MKIYFDGDSWTWGGEIDMERKYTHRFSRLVSDKLGAEEYNISKNGISNQCICRKLLIDHDISQYDLAIIQMTYQDRLEYYHEFEKRCRTISIVVTPLVNWIPWSQRKEKLDRRGYDYKFWTKYYKEFYTETMGSTYEKMYATIIRNHCKVNNVRLILMTNNNLKTEVKFDLGLEDPKYPQYSGGHPNEEGHRLIASDILKLL